MSAERLRRLLDGTLPDPDRDGYLQVPTRAVVIAPDLSGREAALVRDLGLGGRLLVVSDPTTWRVLGERVVVALGGIAVVDELVLEEKPHADLVTAERIQTRAAGCDALVAVGSGTINDLCKYVAHHAGKPCVVFATAPSMNGYTSANAAITTHGHKQSLPATPPLGVFMDLAVLSAAPARMIRSGLGDSLCRSTAQADWLLAHGLLDQPYREAPFQLLAEDEPALLAAPEALLGGDPSAMERLARTLVMSGFGMTLCGSSHPASQGEHLISHYLDMLGDPDWPEAFHGEHIAVTTLTMARLQETLLVGTAPELRPCELDEAAFVARYGKPLGESCWASFRPKCLTVQRARALNRRLAVDWPDIRARIEAVSRPAAELEAVLHRAGAPTRPADLGIPEAAYRDAVLHAREIRDRYTFLDLAADSGRLAS